MVRRIRVIGGWSQFVRGSIIEGRRPKPASALRSVGTRPDNRGSPLAGDTGQPALAHGL